MKASKQRENRSRATIENVSFLSSAFACQEFGENTQLMSHFDFNYSDCLKIWGSFFLPVLSDAVTLSLVIIQSSPALKITALVRWSASWLIVKRPPKAQRAACGVTVSFTVTWAVTRSCEPVSGDITYHLVPKQVHVLGRTWDAAHAACDYRLYTWMSVGSFFCQQAPVYSLLINCLTQFQFVKPFAAGEISLLACWR